MASATLLPQSSAFGKDAYETLFEKAAALFESLAQNHAFFNGNKRMALQSLTIFLRYNGYHFEMVTQEKIDFTVNVVNHYYTFTDVTRIIQEHAVGAR